MKKIAVVTATRAEYGILTPLIRAIHEDADLQLVLLVTGTHLSQKHGFTKRFIEAVRIENEIKKAKGTPISCYDSATNSAYLLYSDGTRKYVRAN